MGAEYADRERVAMDHRAAAAQDAVAMLLTKLEAQGAELSVVRRLAWIDAQCEG